MKFIIELQEKGLLIIQHDVEHYKNCRRHANLESIKENLKPSTRRFQTNKHSTVNQCVKKWYLLDDSITDYARKK